MVVCKFFLQGTCKFGSYCYNEHQVPRNFNYTSFNSNNNQQSTSILRQANFGSSQNTKTAPPNSNIDVNALVKSVVADMTGAEKGGQWLLSCYAPFKEKPAFPGFEDQSPEEIRLGFYEAQKNGSIDQYKQQLQILLQNTLVKVRALQNPSPEVITILQNIYNTPPSSSSGTYGQNTVTTSGTFTQQSNVFANQNKQPIFPQQNVFGPHSPPQTQNIFANAAPQPQNVFAGNNFGGGFANQQSNNIFANSVAQSPNVFAVAPAPAYSSPQTTTNIFSAQITQPQNVFATSQPTTVFQQQQQQPMNQNIFATPPQQNIFASSAPQQPPQQQNLFANSNAPSQQPNGAPPNYSESIFGNATNTNPSVGFGAPLQQTIDESLYSKLEELSEEEKRWFEQDNLDILNIPEKPPTYDMCFKT